MWIIHAEKDDQNVRAVGGIKTMVGLREPLTDLDECLENRLVFLTPPMSLACSLDEGKRDVSAPERTIPRGVS